MEGEHGGALKIRLTAPPVDERVAAAIVLADSLNVPVATVRIVAGEKSRTKQVSIASVTHAQAIKALGL